jgi:hypothetical protein
MMAEFKKEHGIDISKDKMVAQRLKEQAEKSKKRAFFCRKHRDQPSFPHRRCNRSQTPHALSCS